MVWKGKFHRIPFLACRKIQSCIRIYPSRCLLALIALNSSHFGTREKAVRQAINHAIDREGIAKGIFYGTEIAAPFLFAPNVPYADVGLKPYQFAPKHANTLLEQAGWNLNTATGVRAKKTVNLWRLS